MVLPLGLLASLGTGCATTALTLHRDINRVSTFYDTLRIWLNFDSPPSSVPQGLKFSVFLTASDSELGVFGDGIIRIEMFRIDRGSNDQPLRTPVRQWSFDAQEAYPYRRKKPTRYGWAYGFRLPWGDVEVLGREILLIVSFERPDGTVIHGQPKYLKVPKRVFANRA